MRIRRSAMVLVATIVCLAAPPMLRAGEEPDMKQKLAQRHRELSLYVNKEGVRTQHNIEKVIWGMFCFGALMAHETGEYTPGEQQDMNASTTLMDVVGRKREFKELLAKRREELRKSTALLQNISAPSPDADPTANGEIEAFLSSLKTAPVTQTSPASPMDAKLDLDDVQKNAGANPAFLLQYFFSNVPTLFQNNSESCREPEPFGKTLERERETVRRLSALDQDRWEKEVKSLGLETLSAAVSMGRQDVLEKNRGNLLLEAMAYNTDSMRNAVTFAELSAVKWLAVEKGFPLHMVDGYGRNLVHFAALNPNTETIRWLLKAGLNLLPSPHSDETPMHLAAWAGNIPMMTYLRDQGLSVFAADFAGKRPVHLCAHGGTVDAMKWLIAAGAGLSDTRGGVTLLHYAVLGGNVPMAEWLIGQGLDLNATDKQGRSAFSYAAMGGKTGMLDWLTERGITASEEDVKLMWSYAAQHGCLEMLDWLFKRYPDRIVTAYQGAGLMGYATYAKNSIPTLEWLLEHGQDVNAKTAGESALTGAVMSDNPPAVKWLLEHGADIHASPNILHTAARVGNAHVVRLLLQAGADKTTRDNEGKTPAEIVRKDENDELAELLE